MAAVLTCGPNAVLSHRSAAALWGIAPPPTSGIDVLADSDRHARPGLRVRRATLSAVDRTSCDGVPTTSVPRTLLDIAAVAPWALERALEESERLELFDLRAFEELISRSRGRRGVRRLRDAIAAYREPAFTRSELERRFLRLVEEAGLPKPSVNIWVAGHQIDVFWAEERLGVELDGYEFHRTRLSYEQDRRRDEELALAGIQVIRLTWRRLEEEVDLGRRVRRHLERRRRELGLGPSRARGASPSGGRPPPRGGARRGRRR